MNATTMTKAELINRLNELEAKQPVARPAMPVHVAAHDAGAAVRQHVIATTQAVAKGAVVSGAVAKGFFSGLFGK